MPLWFRLLYLAFVAVQVPVYILEYPLVNFLWFSNIALLAGLIAAWLRSALLASMMLVSVGLIEMGWVVDFLLGLALGGQPPFGMVGYMFDPEIPLHVRGLSLYHLFLPFALWWMAWRLGYDRRAFRVWLPTGWVVFLLTRLLVSDEENVNWVLMSPWHETGDVQGWPWLVVLLAAAGVAWWLTHRLVDRLIRHTPEDAEPPG